MGISQVHQHLHGHLVKTLFGKCIMSKPTVVMGKIANNSLQPHFLLHGGPVNQRVVVALLPLLVMPCPAYLSLLPTRSSTLSSTTQSTKGASFPVRGEICARARVLSALLSNMNADGVSYLHPSPTHTQNQEKPEIDRELKLNGQVTNQSNQVHMLWL
jgi:hypothetical protein